MLVPAAAWALRAAHGAIARLAPFALAGFAVGALPVLAFVLRYQELPTPLPLGPAEHDLRGGEAFERDLPMFLGLELHNGSPVAGWLPSGIVVLALAAILGAAVFARLHRGAWRRRPEQLDLVLAVFVLAPVLWLASAYGYLAGEPRYLHPVAGVLAISVAALLPTGRRSALLVASTILFAWVAFTTLSLQKVYENGGGGSTISGQRIRTECLSSAVRALTDAGAKSVYADYWVAYSLRVRRQREARCGAVRGVTVPGDDGTGPRGSESGIRCSRRHGRRRPGRTPRQCRRARPEDDSVLAHALYGSRAGPQAVGACLRVALGSANGDRVLAPLPASTRERLGTREAPRIESEAPVPVVRNRLAGGLDGHELGGLQAVSKPGPLVIEVLEPLIALLVRALDWQTRRCDRS